MKLFKIIFLSFFLFISCSVEEDLIPEDLTNEVLNATNDVFIEIDSKNEASSFRSKVYVPPGATVDNVLVELGGCYNYTIPTQIVFYNGALSISPVFTLGSSGNSQVFLDMYLIGHGWLTPVLLTGSNYAYLNSSVLNGHSQLYFRIRTTNSYCWPNPSVWYMHNF